MLLTSIVVDGILIGLIYALFAVGLSISIGVMRIFNIAYGSVITFAVVQAAGFGGYPYAVIVLVGMAGGAVMAVAVEIVAVQPLQRRGIDSARIAEASFMTTLGCYLMLQGININSIGVRPAAAFRTTAILSGVTKIWGIQIITGYLIGGIVATVLVVFVWLAVTRTQIGRSLRAIAADYTMAQLIGINVRLYSIGIAGVTGMFAGLAGVLLASIFLGYNSGFGDSFLLRGFILVVIGGFGSTFGMLGAGVLLGVAESLIGYYGGSAWSSAGGAALLAAILVFRPNGLFGRAAADRA